MDNEKEINHLNLFDDFDEELDEIFEDQDDSDKSKKNDDLVLFKDPDSEQLSLIPKSKKKENELQSDEKVSTVSERLQYYLTKHNLKQKDIAEMCQPLCEKYNVRIGTNDISQYIRGKSNPNQKRLTILSKALNVPEVWLLGYDMPQTLPDKITSQLAEVSPFIESYKFDFTIEAEDDSLFEDHIYKGDIVYFRHRRKGESGDLVAVIIDTKVIMRRIFYYPDENIIILRTSNPRDDLIFNTNKSIVTVIGKAIAFTSNHINI